MGLEVYKDKILDIGLSGDKFKGDELVTWIVHGKTISMMYAERPDDYHSTPTRLRLRRTQLRPRRRYLDLRQGRDSTDRAR